MKDAVCDLQQKGFEYSAFGDIFLEDLKRYREQQLAAFNIKCIFPLWKRNTRDLLHEFIELGFKAILVCIKSDLLDASFAGRIIDNDFIKDLPPNVDPCGENGEFHTFCFDGPIFKHPIDFEIGEKIYREYKSPITKEDNVGFWFCDILSVADLYYLPDPRNRGYHRSQQKTPHNRQRGHHQKFKSRINVPVPQ